jgi:hypothetical protein
MAAGKHTPAHLVKRSGVSGSLVNYPKVTMEDVQQDIVACDYLDIVGSRGRKAAAQRLQGLTVPLKFDCAAQYVWTFTQLLLEELRSEVAAAHEGVTGSNRDGAGSRLKCQPCRLLHVQRQSKVWVVTALVGSPEAAAGDGWSDRFPRTDDLLLLTKVPLVTGGDLVEGSLPGNHLLALVTEASSESPGCRRVTFRVSPESASNATRREHWQSLLSQQGMTLHVTLLTSLVTKVREFQVSGRRAKKWLVAVQCHEQLIRNSPPQRASCGRCS